MTVEKNILAERGERASPHFFRLDRKQLLQVIAGVVAGWVRTQGALRGRIVEIHLIEMTEDNDPSRDRPDLGGDTRPVAASEAAG